MTMAWILATILLPLVGLPTSQSLREQVRSAEAAFAKTMADRDFRSFATFVSEEAIFFGSPGTLRGKEAVLTGWAPFFEGPDAPFSWEPQVVEVLDSGTLAHSSGPVKDPQGNVVGTFNSVWRLEADGKWRVVFDKGCPSGGSVSSCRLRATAENRRPLERTFWSALSSIG